MPIETNFNASTAAIRRGQDTTTVTAESEGHVLTLKLPTVVFNEAIRGYVDEAQQNIGDRLKPFVEALRADFANAERAAHEATATFERNVRSELAIKNRRAEKAGSTATVSVTADASPDIVVRTR